jgi:hypothetical protein
MANSLPEGITTSLDETTVRASAVVDATPTEVFDLRAAGYPKRHLPNVANSVANVVARFAEPATDRT